MRLPRLVLSVVAMAIAAACSEATNGTGSISQRIGDVARTPGTTEVDFGKLTTFGWDHFYALKPGTTREEVCKFIGAKRNVCGRVVRIERAPDDHMFLVFALRDQLTHIELHALANGQFDFSFPDTGITRSASVFKIRHSLSGSVDILWLELK
jgi:hypothetical protein